MIKFIKGYEGKYGVDEEGNVYSYCIVGSRTGRSSFPTRILTPHTGSNNNYLCVGLSNDDGTVTNALVHRLVAEAFLPNPSNLPEVDHIDDNPQNNNINNLQWVTRQQNINKMLGHSSPIRNYRIVRLLYEGEELGYFLSIKTAANYAAKYGASSSSLTKYKNCRGWTIENVSTIPEGSSIYDEDGCEVVLEFGIKN